MQQQEDLYDENLGAINPVVEIIHRGGRFAEDLKEPQQIPLKLNLSSSIVTVDEEEICDLGRVLRMGVKGKRPLMGTGARKRAKKAEKRGELISDIGQLQVSVQYEGENIGRAIVGEIPETAILVVNSEIEVDLENSTLRMVNIQPDQSPIQLVENTGDRLRRRKIVVEVDGEIKEIPLPGDHPMDGLEKGIQTAAGKVVIREFGQACIHTGALEVSLPVAGNVQFGHENEEGVLQVMGVVENAASLEVHNGTALVDLPFGKDGLQKLRVLVKSEVVES